MSTHRTPHRPSPNQPTSHPSTSRPAPLRWFLRRGPVTATLVVVLLVGMAAAATAATGGSFILGRSNSATTVTSLTNSRGTALSLQSPAGVAPLRVNRTTRIANLNADLLDGRDSTGFLRLGTGNRNTARTTLTNPNGVPLRLTPAAGSAPLTVDSAVRVRNLNADLLDGRDSSDFVSRAQYDALAARVAELETLLAGVSRQTVNGQPTIRFSDVNVQVVNGTGTTDGAPNGRGNLLLGYDTARGSGSAKTGSHTLVVGNRHNYTSFGGIVAGDSNAVTGQWSSVLGGSGNVASGNWSTVAGGSYNIASGAFATVSGGGANVASGSAASVSGGSQNTASGGHASVLGGQQRTLSTQYGRDPQ